MNNCQLLWNLSYSHYGICSNTQTHALVGYSGRVLKKIWGLVIQFCHSSEKNSQRHDKGVRIRWNWWFHALSAPFFSFLGYFLALFFCISHNNPKVWQKQTGLLNMNHAFGSYIQFDINRPEREELCCICLKISKFHMLPLKELYMFCYCYSTHKLNHETTGF